MHPAQGNSQFPDNAPQCATLYVAAPLAATGRALRESLRGSALPYHDPYPNVLAVPFQSDQLQRLGSALASMIGENERRRTRCRMVPGTALPSPAELMQAESLTDFLAWIEGQWLGEVLTHQRLITYFQPIVNCRQPSQVFAYECLTRGQEANGQIIPPDRMYAAARATGQLHALDHAARLKAIESSAMRKIDANIFINFNPRSISDPVECMESVLQAVLASGIDASRFVFEVVESDEIADGNHLLELLEYYREASFRVALDDLGAGYSSLNLLATVKPDFVKLDMGLIHNVDRDEYKSQVASKLLELAHGLGVQTVVEGVETKDEWQWARDHGADFAQGYFFARPSPLPPPVCVSQAGLETSASAQPTLAP